MRKHCQRGFISTITLYFYLYIDFRSYLGKRPLTEREREKMDIINKGLLTKWLRFVAKRSHNKFCMRTELYGVKQKSGKSVLTLKWNHFSVSLYWFCLYKRNDANEQPCTKGFLLVCRGGGGVEEKPVSKVRLSDENATSWIATVNIDVSLDGTFACQNENLVLAPIVWRHLLIVQ